MWGDWVLKINKIFFLAWIGIYVHPVKIPLKICTFICIADMVAHYDGTNAAQILIISPKPPTIVPEWGRLNDMDHTFVEQVNKHSPDTKKSLEALEKFTLPIIEYFVNALNNEDKWVRYLAADALGNMGDLRSTAPLNLLRSDKDPDLRFVSGQSLNKIVHLREILTDSRKMGCDTCLIRYIAEEVIVQQNRT